MIKHIVMIKLKDEFEGEKKFEICKDIQNRLMGLIDVIDTISSYEVGINYKVSPKAFDLVIVSEFDDQDSLDSYINHQAHLDCVEFIGKYKSLSHVVDYQF